MVFALKKIMKRLAFLLLTIPLLFGCAKVKDPEFRRIGNFKVKGLGLASTTIGFNVTYFNPNNFGVTVKETAADIYIDSVYLGRFQQDSTIAVARNAEFSIPISGVVTLATALKLDIRHLQDRDILLRADGSVKVGKAGIFVTRPFHYEGRHRLDEVQIRF